MLFGYGDEDLRIEILHKTLALTHVDPVLV
jgi:hypothetical protein